MDALKAVYALLISGCCVIALIFLLVILGGIWGVGC